MAYDYDYSGDLTKAKDELSGNTITASYDPLNRPTSVSGDASGDPQTSYTYDFDNPTRTDASGTYSFTLDDYGREAALVDPLHPNNPYAWTYAASGPVASVTDPTGNVTTNTYDPLNRLTARSTTGSAGCTNCASLTYTYNDASNIVSSSSTIIGSSANGTTAYAYDAIDWLTTFTPPSAIQPQTYTWNGSPDRASIQTGSGSPLTMTYNNASRLLSDSGGGNYAYDGQGRLTAMPGKTLIYDAAGRLIQVKDGSGTVLATYTYDALDRLRTITEAGSTTRLRYVGLTNAVAQEIDNGSGSVLKNHATDMAGTDLFDFNATGNVSGYLGLDAHADVVWTASTTGAVAATLTYDPFGNLVSSTGSTLPNTRWQSSWQDTTTGLYYVIARWYAPSLGTFLSADPLTAPQSNPQGRDPYAYGAGDAIDRADPDGRCIIEDGVRLYCGGSASANETALRQLAAQSEDRKRFLLGDITMAWVAHELVARGRSSQILKYDDQGQVCSGYYLFGAASMTCEPYSVWYFETEDPTFAILWAGDIYGPGHTSLYDGQWDMKSALRAKFRTTGWDWATAIRGDNKPERLYYDVWGNIEYGYVMSAHHVPAKYIWSGANAEGKSGPAAAGDRLSILIGTYLWRTRGFHLSENDLRRTVLRYRVGYRQDGKMYDNQGGWYPWSLNIS